MTVRRISLTLALCVLMACRALPVPDVENRGSSITVTLPTLEDYPTDIGGISVKNVAKDQLVWKIAREGGEPQLWRFELKLGENPIVPEGISHGTMRALSPKTGQSFELSSQTLYELEIWNPDGKSSRIVRFELTGQPGS